MHFTADPDNALVMIDKLVEKTKSVTQALHVIGRRAISEVKKNFQEGGRVPDNWNDANTSGATTQVKAGKWEPLNPMTILSRRKIGRGHSVLIDTGMLMNSIEYRVENNVLYVGTRVPYGSYHQHGTRNVPARPFLTWLPDTIEAFRTTFLRLLTEEI